MYLKRLEIKGFKSFSSKTVLDFLAPKNGSNSVTSIVGPNGSGKSNISDAIRWVMGEQRLKHLRGKKSSDIIFSGSQTKGQLSAAEVTMVLENDKREVLPDHSEITVTRRLYRSGEGEYLINNNSVRLLDVHLLLAKLQFAQHSYTVVGQGTIDKLLMVSPAERKDFLDEASGIKEYKIKQHQAELKLSRSKENINQAKILIQEVEPRLRLLARQVKKLKQRQEVELQLRENQEQYYGSIYSINKKELDEFKIELDLIDKNYRDNYKNLNTIQEELATLARASSRQQVFDNLQLEHNKIVKEKHDLERNLAIRQGQMQSEYSKAGKQNISWLENKISELEQNKNEIEIHCNELAHQVKILQEVIAKKKADFEEMITKKSNLQILVNNLNSKIIEGQSEQSIRQYSGLLAVQAVIENATRFGKVHGILAELGEVEEQFRLGLEISAGAYLSAIVIDDENVARNAIDFLRQNRLGFATFLPINKINYYAKKIDDNVFNIKGVYGLASNLIKHSSKFDKVFSFVFGNTLVIQDLAVAKKVGIGTMRMVTLEGDIIESSGVMKGGYRAQRRNDIGFDRKLFLDQNTLNQVKLELNEKNEELLNIDTKINEMRNSLMEDERSKEAIESKMEMINERQNSVLTELTTLQQDLVFQSSDKESYGDILKELAKEKQKIKDDIRIKDKEIQVLSKKIADYNEEEEKKKNKVFALQDEMQTIQNKVNELLMERNELRVKIARLETKQDSIIEEVRIEMNVSVENIIERGIIVITKPEEREVISNKIQKLKYQLSLIGGIDDEVIDEHTQTKEKYDFLISQITDLEKAIVDLEKMIVELDDVMKKKRAIAFKRIQKEFVRYIKILFGGGSADMKEIYGYEEEESEEDQENEIEEKTKSKKKIVTGIDIMVNPPGKKIKFINTLSGGERTLASIALICAVLNYNPSPFVVLDEVEAALDETNTRRFSKIVTELSAMSQFIIITHNRVTMHSSDALYGVTMGIDGTSKLLSVKLGDIQTVK